MKRPDWCPEDVWEAAEGAYVHDDYTEQVENTARAILAERERAAKIAESHAGRTRLGGISAWHASSNIAAAIRRGE